MICVIKYSKNADSWINGWIVSRLLRLLAGIANSFSDDNDSILLRGNYGNQTIIICTMESIIRFIKQFIPYDSFCLLIKMKRSCSFVCGNLSKVNFCLLLCDKYFGARRARLSWGITIQWRIIIPPPLSVRYVRKYLFVWYVYEISVESSIFFCHIISFGSRLSTKKVMVQQ